MDTLFFIQTGASNTCPHLTFLDWHLVLKVSPRQHISSCVNSRAACPVIWLHRNVTRPLGHCGGFQALKVQQVHRTFHMRISPKNFQRMKGRCISLFCQLLPSFTKWPYLPPAHKKSSDVSTAVRELTNSLAAVAGLCLFRSSYHQWSWTSFKI